MRSRDVVGRKIVKFVQQRARTNSGFSTEIVEIVLDNGALIRFVVHETESDYVVHPIFVKP